MKDKLWIIAAVLFMSISLSAQVVIKDGGDKIELKGKEVKITSAQQRVPGNITITGSGKGKETYNGNGKQVSVSGSNHNIRITGYPVNISVSGSNNVIFTDGAKSISISGSNNTVTYYNLINKQKPSISVSGQNNSVSKGAL